MMSAGSILRWYEQESHGQSVPRLLRNVSAVFRETGWTTNDGKWENVIPSLSCFYSNLAARRSLPLIR